MNFNRLFTVMVLVAMLGLTLTVGVAHGEAVPADQAHNCRLYGIIAEDVPAAIVQDHLINLPNSLENLSPSNPDGWGICYYPDGDSYADINRGYPAAYLDPNYDLAVEEAALASPRIIVAHIRNTSSGITPASGDPHPFERFKGGKDWLMAHNGTIDKNVLIDLIRPAYFAANPPVNGSNFAEWIDTELYFLFVLQTLEDFNWQVKPALGYVIRKLREEIGVGTSPSEERLNFYLTDGDVIWAYREGNGIYTLYYLYNNTGAPYSAVASQYPSTAQGDWIWMDNGQIVTLFKDAPPVVENIEDYFGDILVVDNFFDENGDEIGGNGSSKAAFAASSTGNSYLTQEFDMPQTGIFAIQWNIYIESIVDISAADRAGWMLIGDNTDATRVGPNSDDSERFVYLGFFRDGGGTSGTMDLVCRDRDDSWTAFSTITSGLNIGQWYTIKVICNIPDGTYDVYVDNVFQSTVTSRHEKSSVTHISFAQWDDGAGAFYVDNVYEAMIDGSQTLTMAVNPSGGGTTDPAAGSHQYADGEVVTITATPSTGFDFDHWDGNVADPISAVTTVTMDQDQIITAYFTYGPIVPGRIGTKVEMQILNY